MEFKINILQFFSLYIMDRHDVFQAKPSSPVRQEPDHFLAEYAFRPVLFFSFRLIIVCSKFFLGHPGREGIIPLSCSPPLMPRDSMVSSFGPLLNTR